MLKVYAHPASQPARTVIWVCLIKGLSIQLHADPKHLAEVNPRGMMPVIDDEGFVLTEMAAILAYLAEKYTWQDLYPNDLQTRARINSYLHAHHSLTRLATMKLMAPHIHVAFAEPQVGNPFNYIFNTCVTESMSDEGHLAEGRAVVEKIVDYIDQVLLQNRHFICGTEHASIADIACYGEIGQLEMANLVDFQHRKNINNWMERVRQLPHHDPLHTYNIELGDIKNQPNTLQRFSSAVEAAMGVLAKMDGVSLA